MGYVTAAYAVVLAGMAFYWWSLASRFSELERANPGRSREEETGGGERAE